MGGVRRALRASSEASGAAGTPPRERRMSSSYRCDLAGVKSTPLGALYVAEVAPCGLGAGLAVVQGHTRAELSAGCGLAARVWSLHVHICAIGSYLDYFEIARDRATDVGVRCGFNAFVCSFYDIPVMFSAKNRV